MPKYASKEPDGKRPEPRHTQISQGFGARAATWLKNAFTPDSAQKPAKYSL